MTGTDFRKWVEDKVDKARTQVELARRWQVTDRTIRGYINGTALPSAETAKWIEKQENVRLEWRGRSVIVTQSPTEEPRDDPGVKEPPGSYAAINVRCLERAIEAVDRLGSLPVDVRAGLIAHCYERMHDAPEETWSESARQFVDLIARSRSAGHKDGLTPSDGHPMSAEDLEEDARRRANRRR